MYGVIGLDDMSLGCMESGLKGLECTSFRYNIYGIRFRAKWLMGLDYVCEFMGLDLFNNLRLLLHNYIIINNGIL